MEVISVGSSSSGNSYIITTENSTVIIDVGLPAKRIITALHQIGRSPEDVEATAGRLYVGQLRLDPKHWYRMQHHFPVIDEDNYDRFAALVIADLSAGPLHETAASGEGMLLVGAPNPLIMTASERARQKVRKVSAADLETEGERL